MRETWVYGEAGFGSQVCDMLAELGFTPRRVPPGGALRPAPGSCTGRLPALALMLVCEDDRRSQAGELPRRLRADADLCDVPLVVAADSARASASVAALVADEVIVHPLRLEELCVRIARARSLHGIVTQEVIELDSLTIDLTAHEVRVHGEPIGLTPIEYRLLELLATHPRHVHTREHLLRRMPGPDREAGERTVDGHVGRLRSKLGPEHARRIRTVRNVGYRFDS